MRLLPTRGSSAAATRGRAPESADVSQQVNFVPWHRPYVALFEVDPPLSLEAFPAYALGDAANAPHARQGDRQGVPRREPGAVPGGGANAALPVLGLGVVAVAAGSRDGAVVPRRHARRAARPAQPALQLPVPGLSLHRRRLRRRAGPLQRDQALRRQAARRRRRQQLWRVEREPDRRLPPDAGRSGEPPLSVVRTPSSGGVSGGGAGAEQSASSTRSSP